MRSRAERRTTNAGNSDGVPWLEATLGEILPIKYGKARTDKYGYERPDTHAYGSNGAFEKYHRALTDGPSIVVGRKGAAGSVHYSSEPCWPIDTAFYSEGSERVFLPFFRYLIEDLRLGALDRSTAIPSLSRDDYNAQVIRYPESLEEQKCIVEEIEKQFTRLDAGVTALKRVQANLKRYRAAVLKAACEGRLVENEAAIAKQEGRTYETGELLLKRILEERRRKWQGRGKYKEPASPDTTGLPPLPEGWVRTTLPRLGELSRGKSKHRPRDDTKLYGGLYPFIQTGDVRKSKGLIREYKQTYSEFGLMQSRLWPSDTLCITIAANIAETAILTFPACFPDSIVGFIHDESPKTVRYVEYFLRTAKEDLDRYAPATAQKNINLKTLERVAVPLPPLAEQERIVEEVERRLSVIEELETAVSANLQRAARLRQSILKQAFSGELVPDAKEIWKNGNAK